MQNSIINLLVLVVAVALVVAAYLVSPHAKRQREQKKADRIRKLAHAGKVVCEAPDCEDMATRFTPNGYFCEWDYEPNIKQMLPNGKFVTWNHRLYWSIRRS